MKRIFIITFSLFLFLIGCSAGEIKNLNEASFEKYQQAEKVVQTKPINENNEITTQVNNSSSGVISLNNSDSDVLSFNEFKSLNEFKDIFNDNLHGNVPMFKRINDDIYQTIEYYDVQLDGSGWVFKTWKLDPKTSTLTLVDETIYNDHKMEFGYELGRYWYDLWTSDKNNYHPYQNLTLTTAMLDEAKKGKLIGVEYGIGININKIKDARPTPMEEGYYEGAPYVFYPEDTYFYNEEEQTVSAVAFKGDRLNITLGEVEAILGTATYEGFNEMENEPYFLYEVGEYSLYISGDNDTKSVRDVILSHNQIID